MKKYNPRKVKLTAYEKAIDESIDWDNLKIPSEEEQKKIKQIATNTLKELKSSRTNIRVNEKDMKAIRQLAESVGMPYQTLISHVLHMYVTKQLVNINEVKKMLEAGLIKTT